MPKIRYTKQKGLFSEDSRTGGFRIDDARVLVTTGGMDVRNNVTIRWNSLHGTSEVSGSLLTLRGRTEDGIEREPLFFHMGGNQYISNNSWYEGSTGNWKYATSTDFAFRWGWVGAGRFDLDYASGGTKGAETSFITSLSITASNGYVGIGKAKGSGVDPIIAQLDVSGSNNAVALAVTGSVDLGGGAADSFFILPRLTDSQRDALSSLAGMLIYNTDTNKLNYYNGTGWKVVSGSAV